MHVSFESKIYFIWVELLDPSNEACANQKNRLDVYST